MGTNFYHTTSPSLLERLRGERSERRHIGKSSAGWCFSLHVYPEDGIHDLPDWEKVFALGSIKDEYGRRVSAAEMRSCITERSWPKRPTAFDYRANRAQCGPNNLARSKIDGRHCIGHGAGTWDLIVGDFS